MGGWIRMDQKHWWGICGWAASWSLCQKDPCWNYSMASPRGPLDSGQSTRGILLRKPWKWTRWTMKFQGGSEKNVWWVPPMTPFRKQDGVQALFAFWEQFWDPKASNHPDIGRLQEILLHGAVCHEVATWASPNGADLKAGAAGYRWEQRACQAHAPDHDPVGMVAMMRAWLWTSQMQDWCSTGQSTKAKPKDNLVDESLPWVKNGQTNSLTGKTAIFGRFSTEKWWFSTSNC